MEKVNKKETDVMMEAWKTQDVPRNKLIRPVKNKIFQYSTYKDKKP